jgi:GT2 family glycosyltransferase
VDLSCVILSFNSARCIQKCLDSLIQAVEANQLDSEIFVVDNGSIDDSPSIVARVAQKCPQVQLIGLEKNYGTTASRNKALAKCTGKFVLILDSDAYISPEALRGLIDFLAAQSDVGLVAPKLIFPDGRPQMSTDQFPTVGRKIERVVRLRQIEKASVASDAMDVDYAISACWLLSREVMDQVGFLDEQIFYAPEDVDYCLRIWKQGFRIVHEPRFVVVHDAQERSRSLIPNRFTWLHLKGLAYYFIKHRYLWSADRLRRRIGVEKAR